MYIDGNPRAIAAGSYVTGSRGFFPGLAITIPTGWLASETDGGELALHPSDRPNDALLLWKDVAAVVTNDRAGDVGHPLDNVGMSTAALLNWLTTTTDFTILAQPKSVTVATVTGQELTLTTSNTANYAWTDCPDNPHCVALFTDKEHWFGNFYAIGGAEVSRIFIATVSFPTGDHEFFVVLDATSAADLVKFSIEAQPIIDSLRLPTTYIDN